MDTEFDIIVAGGGAGGGTLAAACASEGHRVLLVERGGGRSEHMPHDEQTMLIDKRPYDDRLVSFGGDVRQLYMGGILGGGTSVFGGALLRPAVDDFHPGRHYGDRLPAEIHDWPISYSELSVWYDRAEHLFEVRCTADSSPAPLEPPSALCDRSVLPMASINSALLDAAASLGMRAFRLPLSIRTEHCLKCDQCAGFVCPTGARRSASQLVMESIDRGEPLTVWRGTEVEQLVRSPHGQLQGMLLRQRLTNCSRLVRGKRYVLAAGAIGSAVLLQRSGFTHPLIGRNYMQHYSPVVSGIFLRSTRADREFIKQLGISSFYYGTPELPEKMGIIQSLPAPGPLMLARYGLKRLPAIFRNKVRAHLLPLVGIVEDLPHPANRVQVSSDGTIRLEHEFTDYDRQRGSALTLQMARLLKRAGAFHCVTGLIPSREHVAHQCGTLRFGKSPEYAVADPECRLFEQPDVFVADGSLFPTSLGVGPSLTIIANALRVAEIVAAEV